MDLSNRETASAILLGLFLLLLIVLPQTRSTFFEGIAQVSKALFVSRLLLLLGSYFAYTGLIVFVSYRLGLWNVSLTKDTLIVVFFVGLPILINTPKIKDGSKLVGKVVRETLGVSALLVFYLGLEPLPLVGELFSQTFITFCVLMSTIANTKPETKKIGSCFQVLTVIAVIGLLAYATTQFIRKRESYAWDSVAASFGLSVWLPLALLPFIYVFAFVAHCESVLVMLPFFNNRQIPKLRVRLGFLLGLHFSTRFAALFTGRWRGEIVLADTFRDSLDVMRRFRGEVRQRAQAEKARVNLLKQNAGIQGTDDEGLAIDRREFFETKEALDSLFYYQMASKRHEGKYRADLLKIFGHLAKRGLPEDPEINFLLSKNGNAWRVWRMTPGGWFFGIGGTSNVDEKWTYFGAEAPASFPGENHPNWFNDLKDASCEEWIKDDRPIRPS